MLRKTRKYSRKRKVARRNPQIYSRTQSVTPEKNSKGYIKTALIALLILLVYIVMFSPAFRFKDIVITGSDTRKDQIKEIVNEVTSSGYFSNNVLFLSEETIIEEIGKDSGVKEIKILINYIKRELKIEVKEVEPLMLWEERGMRYLVDTEGIIYKEIGEDDEEGNGLTILINKIASNINEIGETPLENKKLDFIKNIIKNFKLLTQDNLGHIEIENSTSEITLFSDTYKIYFDTERDAINQINNLVTVKKEATNDGKVLDYVDLRIETRVFYKTR